jgi:hypothetical protein
VAILIAAPTLARIAPTMLVLHLALAIVVVHLGDRRVSAAAQI